MMSLDPRTLRDRPAWRRSIETWPREWRIRHELATVRLETEGRDRRIAEYEAYLELETEAIAARERAKG